MEIINRLHEDIFANQRVALEAYFKVETTKNILLSAGASLKYGLIPGLYIHFVNDENKWYFYCNGDNDGFRLLNRPNKNSVIICNSHLVTLFLKRTSCQIPCKFPLRLTKAKKDGCSLIEIQTNKPIT